VARYNGAGVHALRHLVLPPETFVNELGWYYLSDQRQTNAALEFLNLSVENYPLSRNVHESLAEAYEFIGNKLRVNDDET
jgi:hypothetical protein